MIPRVVFVDHCAKPSGAEMAMLRLLVALGDRVRPLVLLGEDGPLAVSLAEAGIEVDVLPLPVRTREVARSAVGPGVQGLRAAAGVLPYATALARRLRAENADLVHTNSLKAALYGGLAGRLARVPVVWHVRDRVAADYLPGPAVAMVRTASRVLPAAVVANSRATLATLPAHRRGSVVYNAATDGAPATTAVRPAGRPFTVVIVGRLAPWKGQHVLLDAMVQAFGDRTDVRLVVVGAALFGEDDYAAALGEQARSAGWADRVDFRGHRTDVWAELAGADLLVHASTSPEPFGQVVLEGMAAGLAVVAADEGGPAEVVTSGVDGLLVPARDVDALAAALVALEADPDRRAALGRAARATAAGFTAARSSEGVLAVYRSVLG